MRYPRYSQAGFTAVELLVTLFVAAAFIIAGYQLFNVVIRDGGETRAKAAAANSAYASLRQYSDAATNPCSAMSPLTNSPTTVDGLTDVTTTVTIECAQADAPTLSKVSVIIAYGKERPQQTLTYSTYVDKSAGASTNTEITNGLIGWWKLNDTANSEVGSSHGVVNGATSTSYLGIQNNAYAFANSCCQYIVTSPTLANLMSAATFSAWIYPTATPAEKGNIFMSDPMNYTSGFFLSYDADRSIQTYWYGASSPGYHSSGAGTVPLNQWSFVTAVWTGAQVRMYVNGNLLATYTSLNLSSISDYGIVMGAQTASNTRQFAGSINDVRIYNRALSGSEVTQLYNGGAK